MSKKSRIPVKSKVRCLFMMPKAYSLHLYTVLNETALTLKAPRKILKQTTIYFYFLFFKENNAWQFMWIVYKTIHM